MVNCQPALSSPLLGSMSAGWHPKLFMYSITREHRTVRNQGIRFSYSSVVLPGITISITYNNLHIRHSLIDQPIPEREEN